MIWLCLVLVSQTNSQVPTQFNIDDYLRPPPEPVPCTKGMWDFPMELLPFSEPTTVKYRDGSNKSSSYVIHPGYLVSECEVVGWANIQLAHDRMETELEALKALRSREFELWRMTENQYQQAIIDLQGTLNKVTTPGWFDRNRLFIGMSLGMIGVGMVSYTTAQLIR